MAVLAVLTLGSLGWISWVVLGVSVAAMAFLVLVLRQLSSIPPRPIATSTVRRADERVLAFTASYIVPIAIAAFGRLGLPNLVSIGALVALMVVIYTRAGLYHLNPVLALLGYRLYEVTETSGVVTMLLTKRDHIPQDGTVRCRHLSRDIAVESREAT